MPTRVSLVGSKRRENPLWIGRAQLAQAGDAREGVRAAAGMHVAMHYRWDWMASEFLDVIAAPISFARF